MDEFPAKRRRQPALRGSVTIRAWPLARSSRQNRRPSGNGSPGHAVGSIAAFDSGIRDPMKSAFNSTSLAVGIAVGVALGVAFDQLAIGLGLGVALGACPWFANAAKKTRYPDDPK